MTYLEIEQQKAIDVLLVENKRLSSAQEVYVEADYRIKQLNSIIKCWQNMYSELKNNRINNENSASV